MEYSFNHSQHRIKLKLAWIELQHKTLICACTLIGLLEKFKATLGQVSFFTGLEFSSNIPNIRQNIRETRNYVETVSGTTSDHFTLIRLPNLHQYSTTFIY